MVESMVEATEAPHSRQSDRRRRRRWYDAKAQNAKR